MKVKPAKGRAVRDPNTYELLPADGRDVPETAFWLRRLRDGDVEPVGGEEASAAATLPGGASNAAGQAPGEATAPTTE